MSEKEKKNYSIITFDLFHIAILKYLGYKVERISVADGMKPKGLVTFSSDTKIPTLSDIKVVFSGKELSLQDFSIYFRDTKKEIFKTIDRGEKNVQ